MKEPSPKASKYIIRHMSNIIWRYYRQSLLHLFFRVPTRIHHKLWSWSSLTVWSKGKARSRKYMGVSLEEDSNLVGGTRSPRASGETTSPCETRYHASGCQNQARTQRTRFYTMFEIILEKALWCLCRGTDSWVSYCRRCLTIVKRKRRKRKRYRKVSESCTRFYQLMLNHFLS